MKINKASFKAGFADVSHTSDELEFINSFAKTTLTEDQVYTFSVLLCDNDVDRDFERFSESALGELADLFVGKSGILDHEWKSDNQVARIYRTELVRDEFSESSLKIGENRTPSLNSVGLPYVYLKAFAYILRNDSNQALIDDIEGGIKKETSVGCSVADSFCSICGEPSDSCKHVRGQSYEGKLCFAELSGAVDAYEWSFVAVPAQRNAGVIKRFGSTDSPPSMSDLKLGEKPTLKAFVDSAEGRRFRDEFDEIAKHADAGKLLIDEERAEVLRLALLNDRQLYDSLAAPVSFMDHNQLSTLRKSLESQISGKFPPNTQLPGRNDTFAFDDQAYVV